MPDGFWYAAYLPECSPAELYNNCAQEKLDNLAETAGFPRTHAILKRRTRRIVAETPKSYFKKLFAGMTRRVQALVDAREGYFVAPKSK